MAGDGPCSWENICFWLLQKWLDLSRCQRKTFCFCCQRRSWRWPDFLWKYKILSPQTRLEMFPALLKYTRRCHAYRRCSEYFDYSRPLSSHILCLEVKPLVRSMLPPLVGSGSQAWATECMLTIHFKVCTYSGLLCCWLEVLLLLFWFTVPTETSTFVHDNVQVMKVAPSKSVSGKSQRHWHCLSIYGDTEQHHNQQR